MDDLGHLLTIVVRGFYALHDVDVVGEVAGKPEAQHQYENMGDD